jgi:hypothetical protein
MHFKLLYRVAKVMQRAGLAVLRFHFRGVGRSAGVYDEGRGEQEDARAALDALGREFPGTPLIAGGFSFGAVVALRAGLRDERVERILVLGLPVKAIDVGVENPSGKPALFVQGEHDEFGSEAAIRTFVASFGGPGELVIVKGAGHLFEGSISGVERAVGDWARL